MAPVQQQNPGKLLPADSMFTPPPQRAGLFTVTSADRFWPVSSCQSAPSAYYTVPPAARRSLLHFKKVSAPFPVAKIIFQTFPQSDGCWVLTFAAPVDAFG